MDSWGTYEMPCPDCGGPVEWFSFDSDCRGNPPSGGIRCKGCKRQFTPEEWHAVAELDKEKADG